MTAPAPMAARNVSAQTGRSSADQILSELEAYQKMGMRSFIFSGYPHLEECDYVGKLVLPHMATCSLPHEYGRVPHETPATPLGNGPRV